MSNLFTSKNGKDLCISCDTETEYTHDTDIELRERYIEGAGQLCEPCYNNIMGTLIEVSDAIKDDDEA